MLYIFFFWEGVGVSNMLRMAWCGLACGEMELGFPVSNTSTNGFRERFAPMLYEEKHTELKSIRIINSSSNFTPRCATSSEFQSPIVNYCAGGVVTT
jgi:hypothetical protein